MKTYRCSICSSDYQTSKPNKHRCCSTECGHELRRRNFIAKAEKTLGEPLKEGIERRISEGMSMDEIARQCGFSEKRAIYPIMERLGIKKRSRSDSVKTQWQNNPERRERWGQTISEWKKDHPEESVNHSLIGNLVLQTQNPTSIEKRLMDALTAEGIPFEAQFVVGGKFLCDIALPTYLLIVECDGEYWHSSLKQQRRDSSKDAYLKACGYTVLRLSGKRIMEDTAGCVQKIKSLITHTQ